MIIYLDMDEVLVDFIGGAAQVWGKTREELLTYWPEGVWDIIPPLTKALNLKTRMTEDRFWARLDSEEFWVNLQPMPWTAQLLTTIRLLGFGFYIVSDPGPFQSGIRGKEKWLKNYFGPSFGRYTFTASKFRLAHKKRCLIDDRHETVVSFVAAGGQGIVFPAHHNRAYPYKNDPLAHLEPLLRKLSCT